MNLPSIDESTVGAHIALSARDWVTGRGVKQLLEDAGHEVVLSESEFKQSARHRSPALALIEADGRMPLGTNPTVILCASHEVPVVWLSSSGDTRFSARLPSIVTVGLVVKPYHEAQLLAAVSIGLSLGARLERVEAVTPGATRSGPSASRVFDMNRSIDVLPITPRQREIVRLLLDGGRVSTIAESLDLSQATVRSHLNRIYARLGVHSQAFLVRAIRSGSWPAA